MSDTAIWGVFGTIAVAIIGLISSLLAGRSSRKVGKEANAVTFSQHLIARLESLEDDVKSLRKDLDKVERAFRISLNFIEKFMPWARAGAKPPIPDIPQALHEYLDPAVLEEHQRQQEAQSRPKK